MEKEEVPRQYLDFDPDCTRLHENDCETLILHLPGFNKEQVTVLIDTGKRVKVRGERQMKGKGNQWSRFSKNFHAPENCDLKSVRANFDQDNELLRVTMPRLPPSAMARLTFHIYVVIHYKLTKAWERVVRAVCGRTDVNSSNKRETEQRVMLTTKRRNQNDSINVY